MTERTATSSSAEAGQLTDAKRRLIERLKRVESATAPELAAAFGLTDTAVRQHLDALETSGIVERSGGPSIGRGRPPVHWRLAPAAAALFPDRHADLAVELVRALRTTLGDEAADRVLAERTRHQLEQYRAALPEDAPVPVRIGRLAELRTAEGYLAEAVEDPDDPGAVLLVEHHCPVCSAAAACPGLCSSELELFRASMGPGITVERTQHVLSGDTRCTYRFRPTS